MLARDSGLFISSKLPFILGANLAGEVLSLGPNVTKYVVGQHIYGQGKMLDPTPDTSGLQEYALLHENFSAAVPEGFTDDKMATLPVNATTSFAALFHGNWFGFPPPFPLLDERAKTFKYEEKKIVIIGAGSNVGKLGIQFAALAGVGTIIAVASPAGEEELRSMGATHVIDRHSSSIVQQVHEIVGGEEGVEYVYDSANFEYELATSLVPKGKESFIAVLHVADDAVERLKAKGKELCTARVVTGIMNNWVGNPVGDMFWESLGKWVSEGKVRIPGFRVIEGLDVEKVEEALAGYREGKPANVIVHPHGKREG